MDVKEAIKNRRAYRSFDHIDISDEIIKDFAESAQVAPSCNNNQPWNFVFVRDKQVLQKIFPNLTAGNKWVEKASLIIAVFSKPENDCIIKGIKDRLYYLFDIGMATAFIILRATELNLVAHPIAGFDEEQVKKNLGIPNEMQLITLVIVGKHSKEINPVLSDLQKLGEKNRPPRKKLEEFIFIDKYDQKIKI